VEKNKNESGVSISVSVPLVKGDRVRAGYSTGRLVYSIFIVCMCKYGCGTVLGDHICLISIWIAFGDKC